MNNTQSSFSINQVEVQDKMMEAHVSLDEKSHLFEGHFPNDPIMPGVLNIEIIEHLLGVHMTKKIKQINQIKFLKPVVPNSQESLFYRMEFNTKADHRQVATIIGTNNEETFVKIQAEII